MLITNGRVVTFGEVNQIIENCAVRVDGARIADLGDTSVLEAAYPEDERVDARGQLVMPGNICAHTHFYGAFARGMAIPGDPPRDLMPSSMAPRHSSTIMPAPMPSRARSTPSPARYRRRACEPAFATRSPTGMARSAPRPASPRMCVLPGSWPRILDPCLRAPLVCTPR